MIKNLGSYTVIGDFAVNFADILGGDFRKFIAFDLTWLALFGAT